jgi:uncharacterized membrane protein YraQ (UPF0718 family)
MEIIKDISAAVIDTVLAMSPYLLFGFLVAGILHVMIRPETVERHLGGRGLLQVVKASLFGVPLPLCSCGVIPVAVSLRKSGAGRGAVTSFLISTPQTGVDSIFVTFSLLGPVYAVFRPVAAFVSGILGGSAVSLIEKEETAAPGRDHSGACAACGAPARKKGLRQALSYGFITLPRDINKALIAGVLIAGVIGALVPDDFFAAFLGGGLVSMLVMAVAGIPIYVCATASVPIAAALIAKGVSPGAALVFLMTGPATNAATIFAVSKVMGRRTAGIYLASVALTAIAGGLLLDGIYSAASVSPEASIHWMPPGWIALSSAALLTVVIAAGFFHGKKGPIEEEKCKCDNCK